MLALNSSPTSPCVKAKRFIVFRPGVTLPPARNLTRNDLRHTRVYYLSRIVSKRVTASVLLLALFTLPRHCKLWRVDGVEPAFFALARRAAPQSPPSRKYLLRQLARAAKGRKCRTALTRRRSSSDLLCRTTRPTRPNPRSHRQGTRFPERYVHGMSTACAWHEHGMCMACAWPVRGLCMARACCVRRGTRSPSQARARSRPTRQCCCPERSS